MKFRQIGKEYCLRRGDKGSEKWRIYRENLKWQSLEIVIEEGKV